MAGEKLGKKEVPWCTVCLVTTALICHVCVLVGNLKTSTAMQQLGTSTAGWSKVGLGVGRSFDAELDDMMAEVSDQLVGMLSQISTITDTLEMIVGIAGNATDEAVSNATSNHSLLGASGVALLQTGQGNISESIENLKPYILDGVEALVVAGVTEVTTLLDKFYAAAKPVLETISEWIVKFGDKLLTVIESFGTTIDKVQKIFDEMMTDLGNGGEGFDTMLYETWGLFDLEAQGNVTVQNLQDVGTLYGIQALYGNKPKELMDKYDADGNGVLTDDEMPALVQDDSIPGAMSVMLRRYARALGEIGGQVGAGVMRDEVALGVAKYFQLVCAKNYSKVTWVSDALGNGSLSSDFTGAVYAEMCLIKDSVDKLTTMDSGALVIDTMYMLHPEHTLYVMDLMSDPDWWYTQGFDPFDQPTCIEVVTDWIIKAEANHSNIYVNPPSRDWGNSSDESLVQIEGSREVRALTATARDKEVLKAMPAVARAMAETNMKRSMVKRQHARAARKAQMFSSQTSRNLAKKLMSKSTGGVSTTVVNPNADQLMNSGQPALPETLVWAQWLKNNATTNADIKQGYCADYSGDSSSTLDSFATQIQGMAKRVASFVSMMEYWASPTGIKKIESMIEDFKDTAVQDILDAVEGEIEGLVNQTLPIVESTVEDTIVEISETLANTASAIVATPLEQALETAIAEAIEALLPGSNISGDVVASTIVPLIMDPLVNKTVDQLEEIIESALENLVDSALDALENATNASSAALLQTKPMRAHIARSVQKATIRTLAQSRAHSRRLMTGAHQRFQADLERFNFKRPTNDTNSTNSSSSALGTSTVWTTLTGTLVTLVNLLPVATETLKDARTEVSDAASNFNSIFGLFEVNGPAIFNTIAELNSIIWTLYFIFLAPLALLMLYYAFWAGGYFGGPQPIPKEEDESERPQTWREKCGTCWTCCCACCVRCHDTQLCFWSAVILIQVIVLLMFIISIVLTILAGVKAFITAGCAQIYLLVDADTCTATMSELQSFISTFFVLDSSEALADICPNANLLACEMITSNMTSSTLLTTIFSFVGSIVSLQMIIESAVLHEQARYRRLYNAKVLEEHES